MGEQVPRGDAQITGSMTGEATPIPSHGGLVVQLVSVVVKSGKGQYVADPEGAVPEVPYRLLDPLKEEEDFAVLDEFAELELFQLMRFGPSANQSRTLPAIVLPCEIAGNLIGFSHDGVVGGISGRTFPRAGMCFKKRRASTGYLAPRRQEHWFRIQLSVGCGREGAQGY